MLDFSVRLSSLLPHEWLHQQRKLLKSWYSWGGINYVYNTLCSFVVHLYFITLVMLNCWSYAPAVYPVMVPWEHYIGFYWTFTLVLGSENYFLLKSKLTSIIAYAEIFGLRLKDLSMFNAVFACSRSLSHRCIGNRLPVPLRPEKKKSSVSWYPFLAHFFCVFQVVPIFSLYSFSVKKRMLRRPHYPAR